MKFYVCLHTIMKLEKKTMPQLSQFCYAHSWPECHFNPAKSNYRLGITPVFFYRKNNYGVKNDNFLAKTIYSMPKRILKK